MYTLQVGAEGLFLLFIVLPGVALAAAVALSVYEIYRIGERKLLIVVAILLLMLQHQVLEAIAFLGTGEAVAEGIGEVFETGANLIAAGSVYYVLRFARRERRLVQNLERSEQQYRNLVEESPVPILLHGPKEIRYANDAAVELFDADDWSALVGDELSGFLDGDSQEQVRASVLTDDGSDVLKSQLHTLKDRTRYATLTGAPADYEGEDVRQVVVQDLTKQRRREREFEQIFNNVHDIISINDPETGEILRVNDTMCELLGYDREEILELGVDGLSAEGYTREQAREFFQDVIQADAAKQTQWAVETSDDETRWLEVSATEAEIGGERRLITANRDTTERRRREREFEEIFNGVHDQIAVFDPETYEMVAVNDRMVEVTGYNRDRILEERNLISATDDGYDYSRAKQLIDEVVDTGEPKELEWHIETADGERRIQDVQMTLVTIGGENRVVTVSRDVTERKRREHEYEQIFNSVTNGITVFHPETGEILDVNQTYHELLGYDDLETIQQLGIEGLSVTEEGYTADRGRELIREVAETGEPATVEWRGERKDGTRLWLEATLASAEIGGEKRVLSIQRDITERKRREREYEQIFDSVNDGIIVWDPEPLDIIDANEAYLEMLGYDDIETLREQGVDGLSVTEEGYTAERGREIHQRVVETGESELVEWKGETSTGKRLWLEVKITPAVIGGEDRTISINRDVTDRKLREQRLVVFNRILRHNLRNQVDVIKSHAEVLTSHTDGEHAGRIIAAADKLAEIGNRAREIDRVMSKEREESPVDLTDLVHEALDATRRSDRAVNVTVDTPESTRLVTDGEVLCAVLKNAVDNALRHADSTVSVTVERVPSGYRVDIDDDGPGIPEEELAPLHSGTETDLQHGRGLGLWQLEWGLTKLDGNLAFDTSDGTTVRMTIPDLQAAQAPPG